MVLWITVTILIEYSATLSGLFRYHLARVHASSAILEALFLASLLCGAVFVCKGFRGADRRLQFTRSGRGSPEHTVCAKGPTGSVTKRPPLP